MLFYFVETAVSTKKQKPAGILFLAGFFFIKICLDLHQYRKTITFAGEIIKIWTLKDLEIARNLKKAGVDIEVIQATTGLSKEELENLL